MTLQSDLIDFDAQANRQRIDPCEDFSIWNDRHLGEDVFIIGSSPQLNDLTHEDHAQLRRHVTLGTNRSFYRVALTYFMSSHLPELLLLKFNAPETDAIYFRMPGQRRVVEGIHMLNKAIFSPWTGLSRYLVEPLPALATKNNIVLAMTHLAIVMGAKRIVFVGVDQANYAYHYSYDQAMRETIKKDLLRAQEPEFDSYYTYEDREKHFNWVMESLLAEPQEREAMPYNTNTSEQFSFFFDIARTYGVEVHSTLEGSIVHGAGAKYTPLGDFWSGTRASDGGR